MKERLRVTVRMEAIADGTQWIILCSALETGQKWELYLERIGDESEQDALRRASQQIAVHLAPSQTRSN